MKEFGPGGRVSSVGWAAVSCMLIYKEGKMYGTWQIRFRHIFDLRFVVRSAISMESNCFHSSRYMITICCVFLQMALMYRGASLDFEYMNTMMSPEALGYRLDWTKKVKCDVTVMEMVNSSASMSTNYHNNLQLMLPIPMMNSWSLYVVDTEEKTLLVMDPCETSSPKEVMKAKHEDNATLILEGLRRCIHANIAGWYVPSQGWRISYNTAMHGSCEMYVDMTEQL